MRFLQDHIENQRELAGSGVDDLQYLDESSFLSLAFVALRRALRQLLLKIGDGLLQISQSVVARWLHLATSLGSTYGSDHTLIGAGLGQ